MMKHNSFDRTGSMSMFTVSENEQVTVLLQRLYCIETSVTSYLSDPN